MTSKLVHRPEPALIPTEDARRIARSARARRAAEARRTRRAKDGRSVLRRVFSLVTNGRTMRKWFLPLWAVGAPGLAPTGATDRDPIEEAIVSLVQICESTYECDALGFPEDEVPGFAGEDIVVWYDGRIRAIIRRGADGNPEVTRFAAPGPIQGDGATRHDG